MDIKARIEEVINEKGLTKKVVAERMGKFNQAFNSLLTNPKWETIELVATAIGISTQEMLFGIKPEQPAPQPADELPFNNERQPQVEEPQTVAAVRKPKDDASDLPFNNEPEKQSPGVFVCPHCGAGVSFGAFVVSKPAEKEGEQ